VFGSIVAQNDLNLNMNGQFEGIVNAVRNEERMRQRREAAGQSRPVDENVRIKESIAKNMNAAGDAADNAATAFERAAKRIELSGTAAIDLVASAAEAAGGRGFRNRLQTAASALGLTSGTDAEQADLFGEIADSMEGGGASRRADRARAVAIARRDQGTRRMAREQSLGGRVSSALGFATNDEGRIADFDGMKAGAELLTGTVNSLTNGLTNLFDTLVSGSADAGTAFQAFASGLLTELGKMAVNKGLFYTFEGIAALFSAPPAAPLYFAAGAGLLAIGAGLGIAGAATRPQTPATAADTSTARNLAPRSNNSGSSMRDLAPVTVVMSSLVPAGPGDAQRARNGLRDARRRGFADGNYAPRKVEH
jgi:hypothetical protein